MPFSQKQREFFDHADHRWNIKTGATRSGKTYMDYFVIPKRIRARAGKPGLVLILGVTKSTIERNILEPMRQIWGDKLVGEINSKNICYLFGEKCYCLGAEKVSQVSKIRGSSVKYCYGDEVADWNEEVFELLKSRLDKPYSCFDGALNPQSPGHWLKKFLDSDADIYCQRYTIFDNPFLPEDFVNSLCKEYAGSVFYKRYILGKWALAEGLVYSMFQRDKNVVKGTIESGKEDRYYISVDYGTVNPFAVGIFQFDGTTLTMIREVHYSGKDTGKRLDNEAYYKLMDQAAGELDIERVIVDPSAAGFIETIKKYGKYLVTGAVNDVLNGIQEVTKYINYGILKIHESCTYTLNEFEAYCWDDDAKEDAVIKENDHHMDLIRYLIYTVIRRELRWII
ncbi:MAG: PBSX family phage terminase large subunit [Roseburia sp.]|nr:PBSX family phage terminase large subunit [Roseburia sp.]